ncbi:ADP-ribose pyrophosphatase YjhB (NUDIX family) [Halomonas campaniensis]|uniref:ADP-ribose pyrophosphatase YjhB (NUDIX family) n=1 Tax=Halomonas campaniensis TaxID=213554 RepID=A0A7W5K1W3_9GAMM|nr:NUDIX hydrolase [Halomonas campaniensis]MBB3330417.1 ADP-ribose pyrophosphatase YjhB (NUDIX family) [Halomonas campaniensis]
MPDFRDEAALRPVPAVSAALIRDGHILMVRRRYPPNAGRLALPGGKVEAGESLRDAAARELREETGVEAIGEVVLTAIDLFDHDALGSLVAHYVIVVIGMRWRGGVEAAADDATELRWMDLATLDAAGPDVCETAAEVARRLLQSGSGEETALRACASTSCVGNL